MFGSGDRIGNESDLERNRRRNREDQIWNAAIDECIKVANKYDSYGPAYEMRSLKK
mgnify:CR=1 FL=1